MGEALDFDAIAEAFDPYICKLSDEVFTGQRLRNIFEWEKGDIRSIAVCAVDSYHGFTCEHSPWERQHISEYDTLEQMLRVAIILRDLKPEHKAVLTGEAVRGSRGLELRGSIHPGRRCWLQRQGLLVDRMYSQELTPLGEAVREALTKDHPVSQIGREK